MIAQHTSGPWYVTSEDDYPTGQVSTSPLGNGDICVIYNDNAKADACLIAAAPELLSSLLGVLEALAFNDEEGLIEHAPQFEAARYAIAKATGTN